MRGEYAFAQISRYPARGSPPLARGVRKSVYGKLENARITPACAGSTPDWCGIGDLIKDHPRLRGEYESRYTLYRHRLGSPPLARGVLGIITLSRLQLRITPACAGSTTPFPCAHCIIQDHPRLRGEYLN